MNTQTPRRTIEDGNDIVIEGKKPDWIYLLLEDFKPKEMIEKNRELRA